MMNRWNDARVFNNDNIHIKLSRESLDDYRQGKFSDIELISFALEDVDTYIIGEQYCLSNWDMGCTLYNCNRDKVYILSFKALEEVLMQGKTLILKAHTPDETDREIIEEEG